MLSRPSNCPKYYTIMILGEQEREMREKEREVTLQRFTVISRLYTNIHIFFPNILQLPCKGTIITLNKPAARLQTQTLPR